jgi:hypothetical protein
MSRITIKIGEEKVSAFLDTECFLTLMNENKIKREQIS